MKKISYRFAAFIAAALLSACSTFQSPPEQAGCPAAAEPVACPVCPETAQPVPQCPEPQVVEKIVTVPAPVPPAAKTAGDKHLPIVGAVEWVTVEPGNVRLEARIDTGAATTSIHVEDQQLVEKDGKRWVQFSVVDPATGEKVAFEQRLRRTAVIKTSDRDKEKRYVVKLWISLGDARSLVDVTLTDRGHMEYPMLIGRNMLVDNMIVDVSRKHVAAR
jgi:hypothetical protein